jgi:hypothetical protein
MKNLIQYISGLIKSVSPIVEKVLAVKDIVKYISIGITAISILIISLRGCEHKTTQTVQNKVVQSKDSGFVSIIKHDYRRASIPFLEHPSKPPVRLPKGMLESDVKNVLIVVKSLRLNDSSAHRLIDSTAIITAKDGSIYIDTAQVKSVEMIAYEEPILRFGSFISLGVALSLQQGLHLTLAAAFSPLQICGVVQFPLLALDTEGVGAGVAARTHEISLGILFHQPFTGDRQLKLSFTYNL